MTNPLFSLLVSLSVAVACNREKTEEPFSPAIPAAKDSVSQEHVEGWLDKYDLSNKAAVVKKLPKRVSEASGLATSDDGRLFTHDDEMGVVYQVSDNAEIVKRFSLGSFTVEADFEGIAIAGERFFLVTSSGTLFEFKEAENGQRVSYEVHRTRLSENNDIEGLEYDPETNALLLACKESPGRGYKGFKAVYAFSLTTMTLQKEPWLLIPVEEVKKEGDKGKFNPSGIAIHPISKTVFIISADGESIIEMSRNGKLLSQRELPRKINSQPEGIAFAPDLSILICNDGQGKTGTLVRYTLKEE